MKIFRGLPAVVLAAWVASAGAQTPESGADNSASAATPPAGADAAGNPAPAVPLPDFSTPENAALSIQAAYIAKDLEAAVATQDFMEGSRLMLETFSPILAKDPDMVKQTAQSMETEFRKRIADKGFPDRASMKCSIARKQEVSPTLVKLTEACTFAAGGGSVKDIQVFHGSSGWRLVNVPK